MNDNSTLYIRAFGLNGRDAANEDRNKRFQFPVIFVTRESDSGRGA